MPADRGQPGPPAHRDEKPTEWKLLLVNLRAFVLRNYLPLAFFVATLVALSYPLPGEKVLEPKVKGVHVVTFINICVVFFISGLTLRTTELKEAFTRSTALGTIFGFVSIVGITPNLAWAARSLPFNPEGFAAGMAIFCIVPTTLGVGVSLVNTAKGNSALAIFLTVATNVLGVLIIPLWLKAVLQTGANGIETLDISYVDIFVKLLLSFFVPSVIGKVLREASTKVCNWQRDHKVMLSLINNTSLALIIWQTLSSARDTIVNAKFGNMLVVILSTIIIHLIYLAFNTLAMIALRVPLPEAVSIVIMASQKSAPVAVTVILYITSDAATQGVLVVPAVVGQIAQIFIGQPLAHYLAGRLERWRAKDKTATTKAAAAAALDNAVTAENGMAVIKD